MQQHRRGEYLTGGIHGRAVIVKDDQPGPAAPDRKARRSQFMVGGNCPGVHVEKGRIYGGEPKPPAPDTSLEAIAERIKAAKAKLDAMAAATAKR
jgi:hypothetical protein